MSLALTVVLTVVVVLALVGLFGYLIDRSVDRHEHEEPEERIGRREAAGEQKSRRF
jgi:hypothetical protein